MPTICAATTAKGQPCRAAVVRGADRCSAHLGVGNVGGRPTKFSPQVAERVVALVRAGNYLEVAGVAAGVSRTTLYSWLQRGRAEGAPRELRDFADRVDAAKAEAEARAVALVSKAARTSWQAAVWWLERSSPERWARVTQREAPQQPAGAEKPADATEGPKTVVDELQALRDARSRPSS